MAYLKLMMDEKEIAHLSEEGQYLCANEGGFHSTKTLLATAMNAF